MWWWWWWWWCLYWWDIPCNYSIVRCTKKPMPYFPKQSDPCVQQWSVRIPRLPADGIGSTTVSISIVGWLDGYPFLPYSWFSGKLPTENKRKVILEIHPFSTFSTFMIVIGWLPSLKLTARTWKWMVGIRSFPFGMAYFQGLLMLVLGSVRVGWLLGFFPKHCQVQKLKEFLKFLASQAEKERRGWAGCRFFLLLLLLLLLLVVVVVSWRETTISSAEYVLFTY